MLSRIQFNDGVLLGLGSNQLKHVENALIDVTHKVHHKPMIAVEIACDKISQLSDQHSFHLKRV